MQLVFQDIFHMYTCICSRHKYIHYFIYVQSHMCILLYKYYLCMCMCTYWLCVYCKRCSVLYKSTSCSPRTGNVVAFYSVISLASWFQQSQCNFLLLNKQTAVMSRHCGSLQLTYWSRKKNAGCLGSFPGWKQPGLFPEHFCAGSRLFASSIS